MLRQLARCTLLVAVFAVAARSAACDASAYEEAMARGSALLEEAKSREALSHFERAAAAARRDPADGARELRALKRQLDCLVGLNEKRGMRDVVLRMRQLRLRGGQPLLAARHAIDLGYLHAELGQYVEAHRVLRDALSVLSDAGKKAHVAQVNTRIADVYRLERKYAQALHHADLAALYFHHQTKWRGQRADVLNILGIIHLDLGDADRALAAFEEALEFYSEKEAYQIADVRLNMGVARYVRGEVEKALEQIEQARDAYAGFGDTQAQSRALTQWGFALALDDRHDEALEKLRGAVKLAGDDVVGAAYASVYVADALLATSRPKEAGAVYAQVRKQAEALGDRQLQCHAERGAAEVLLAQGKPGKALTHVRRAVARIDAMVAGLAPVAGAYGRSRRQRTFDVAVDAGFASGDPALVLEYLEMSRARSLLGRLGMQDVLGQVPLPEKLVEAEAAARERVIAAKTVHAAAIEVRDLNRARAAHRDRLAAELAYEERLDDLQRYLQKDRPLMLPPPVTLKGIAAGLGARERMVLFGVTESGAHALVIRKKGEPRLVELGSPADIQRAVDALDVRALDDEAELKEAIASLRKRVWDPLHVPTSVRRVLVSPDGPLAHVPFQLFAREIDFAFIPSAAAYDLLSTRTKRAGTRMFAVGDPAYEAEHHGRTVAVYAGSSKLERLPGTRKEIEAIRRAGDEVRYETDATEDAVRDVLGTGARWGTVLFACHGIANERRPAHSGLALTPSAAHDGFLSVVELYGLKLNADLVVLSACDSGRGKALHGEGMLGLASACMNAGAPRIVASLWKVDDDATRAFMEVFHRVWRGGPKRKPASAAVALREAATFVREQPQWEHPYYWAAWVLWGTPD